MPIDKPTRQKLMLDSAMKDAGIKNTYELANRAGISPSILYKFRKGRTQRFYGETQLRLAAVLPNLFGQTTLSKADFRIEAAKMQAITRNIVVKRAIAADRLEKANAKMKASRTTMKTASVSTPKTAKAKATKKTTQNIAMLKAPARKASKPPVADKQPTVNKATSTTSTAKKATAEKTTAKKSGR